mmetsp:Transcript_71582/g.128868  ORF Transcript_71582/g.128868 Transcript_71582/m.128868 type:complete len:521 (-) Transcript_71582:74-1636(-)
MICGKGPWGSTAWFFLLFCILAGVAYVADSDVIYLTLGVRSLIAFAGYLVMQIGLWHSENKWDEEGSAAWLEAARGNKSSSPEELEDKFDTARSPARVEMASLLSTREVEIPPEKLKAAFPVPWGFLVGWWLWGISYMFPIDGSASIKPTGYGIAALGVCVFVSIVASVPMSDAVMNRLDTKKKILSLLFVSGWITLGVVSALDVQTQLAAQGEGGDPGTAGLFWVLWMLGPVTIIVSQKELFGARKMGTLWEESGKPNFRPVVYNMGGPLFVWGWFMLWVATSGIPGKADGGDIYPDRGQTPYIPIFLNLRTLLCFIGGCGMVPVVRFLDYSHDEDGKWLGENEDGLVFSKWWVGTDGTYFGVFLESPWPFVIMWSIFGFSSFFALDGSIHAGTREIVLLFNCVLQGIDAGILIQQNLYAGNMAGKSFYSVPFLLLFIALAINIGFTNHWHAILLSLPGALLIVAGQKTVFGARKRGDYTMQNPGKANPYDSVFVYSWGEVFFMMGWILICLGLSLPTQ